jgi:multidrug efflux pump subunit AcrA (membrane-fusion protein)
MNRVVSSLSIALTCVLIFETVLIAQTIELVSVVSKGVSRTIDLPGEFQPYLSVTLHSRVAGFVEKVLVDRGSMVKTGDVLVELSAPEMSAQIAEAESKVQIAESERLQAEAKLTSMQASLASLEATQASAQATYDRLKAASQTAGAVSGNEVDVALRLVESQRADIEAERGSIQAQRSSIDALRNGKAAAEASLHAVQEMKAYLRVTAPFDGVVTDRLVHPGALVGPSSNVAMLVIQQVSTLRLIVAVPEENVGSIAAGAKAAFRVPAFPNRMFSGTIARLSRVLDPKTRSMAVELDVANKDQALAPGMYPTVTWPVQNSVPALYVPKTSVVTTTERTFVVREKNGKAEWVDVRKGPSEGDLIEVTGGLHSGDRIIKRATDEMREGMALQAPTK